MKPFLHGKKNLDLTPLRPATPHVHAPKRTVGVVHPGPVGPHVAALKEGDKVVRLVVTCSCGERIEVDCLYPANV